MCSISKTDLVQIQQICSYALLFAATLGITGYTFYMFHPKMLLFRCCEAACSIVADKLYCLVVAVTILSFHGFPNKCGDILNKLIF